MSTTKTLSPQEKIAAKVAADKAAKAVETPAAETPKVETPAAQTPKVETPAAETPKVETPAAETPKVETPAAETPKVETPGFTPKKGEENLYHVELSRGPKFDANTGARIKSNSFNQSFSVKEFTNFKNNANQLGFNYTILHTPKGV